MLVVEEVGHSSAAFEPANEIVVPGSPRATRRAIPSPDPGPRMGAPFGWWGPLWTANRPESSRENPELDAIPADLGSPEDSASGGRQALVSVILPTYNERECVQRLSPRLEAFFRKVPGECIVVDDSSPDGTAEEVRRLEKQAPFRLISRPRKMGLASAVLTGIRAARGEVVIVMDADGSHPPELLPSLIRPLLEGRSEFVAGSRRLPKDRPGFSGVRVLASKAAALLARPLTSVEDPMSGFFAFRRHILDRAEMDPIGYKIGLEILAKCQPSPLTEVPYSFGARLAGESKLGPNEIRDYVHHVVRLYRWRLSRKRKGRGGEMDPTAVFPSRSQSDPLASTPTRRATAVRRLVRRDAPQALPSRSSATPPSLPTVQER